MCFDDRYEDITGIKLIPGNEGESCPGNGERLDDQGNGIECCCDECDYYLEYFPLLDK